MHLFVPLLQIHFPKVFAPQVSFFVFQQQLSIHLRRTVLFAVPTFCLAANTAI
jgi:hypothetical protein